MNLLFRYYDPDEGAVLLDGHDIRDLTFRGLRKHMAIVLQDPFLFSASVMENIRYGNLEATDEDVFRAAKEAGIHDYIMSMPQGYDTPIRESANNISTGQKQLLSIARALVANPKILVLDEATSKVDPFTELIDPECARQGVLAEDDLHNRPPPLDDKDGQQDTWSSTTGGWSRRAPTKSYSRRTGCTPDSTGSSSRTP